MKVVNYYKKNNIIIITLKLYIITYIIVNKAGSYCFNPSPIIIYHLKKIHNNSFITYVDYKLFRVRLNKIWVTKL